MTEYMTSDEKREAIENGTLTQLCDCDDCIIARGTCDCLHAECVIGQ